MLDKQISIISCDTGNFYYDDEAALHERNRFVRTERRKLINGYDEKLEDKTVVHHMGTKEIINELKEYNISEKDIISICNKDDFSSECLKYDKKIKDLLIQYSENISMIHKYSDEAKQTKKELLDLLSSRVELHINQDKKNKKINIRTLNEDSLKDKNGNIKDNNIISVFDSSLTRMIGVNQDEFTDAFMVVQVYYFDVAKDLIYYGFMYKGEKYIYFTSSAGQIRTKKTVFIKESIWKKYEKTIMCGLTIDTINQMGGNNPNKHLAYMALTNSATDLWQEFNIDKTIVIDDFETNVFGTYDLVDDEDYSIKRVSDYVPITHTDGAGMMLPCMGKNRMVRLPWVKGLLGVFDFVKFIQVHNCSPIIKDVYGVEHNIIDEEIQIIFTKSQFKMWKYYSSWKEYKEYFKKYNCTAGYTNMEEDRIKNATINYQMLQTLTDVTKEELQSIISSSVDKLKIMCPTKKDIEEGKFSKEDAQRMIKSVFGVTPYNRNKTYLQKSIELYPNLINDEYLKVKLRDIKNSLIKQYKAGKLEIDGKYTFLLPDFYAACEYWFMGIKDPNGLLQDKEVFCWLFRKSEKLDCLRSPHLYKEHAIRKNIAFCSYAKGMEYNNEKSKQLREWFSTDAIYTSCHDLISKILMFDVDGDKSLVVCDKEFIKIAEKNMQDIVPLYYNMRKAHPVILNNQSIYNGLNAAFTGSNIGQYSNNISKIWNSDIFVNGTDKEKREAIDVVKLLCMENNFVIDAAKTLYMPTRPKFAKRLVKKYTQSLLPTFFMYAKDKQEYQVEDKNNSLVNRLSDEIPNPRINCKVVGFENIDYTLLMNNPDIDIRVSFNRSDKLDEKKTEPLIIKYLELSKSYGCRIKNIGESFENVSEELSKAKAKKINLYRNVCNEIKNELSQFGFSDIDTTDILVKYLYDIKENKYKDILWMCYGNIIYNNLSKHIKPKTKTIQCIDCGKWIEVDTKNNETCRCKDCRNEYRKFYKREKQKEYRQK